MNHTPDRLKRTALYVLIFGLVAHAFVYFNLVYSHDSVIVSINDGDWQVSLGRYLQPVYELLRGKLAVPWLIGLLALAFIALSAFLLCGLLDIRSKAATAAVAGVLVTNAVFTISQATYLYLADVFMLALLLALLGVTLTRQYRFGFLFAALPFAASLALYQAYLAAAVGVFLLLGLQMLLQKRPLKEFWTFAGKAAAALLIGGLIYYLGMRFAFWITGVAPASSYNSLSAAGAADATLLESVFLTYKAFFRFFLKQTAYNTVPLLCAGCVLLLSALVSLQRILKAARPGALRSVLMLLLLCVFPFGLTITVFFARGLSHEVMLYPLCLVYVAAVWLIDWMLRDCPPAKPVRTKLVRGISVAAVCVLLFCNVVFSNQAYLKKKLEYDASLETVSRLVDRMENVEGYVPGETPVAIAGLLEYSYAYSFPGFRDYFGIAGLEYHMPLTFYGAYEAYFENIAGRPINLLSEDACAEYAALTEVVEMPCFPSLSCCKMIDGVLVVKLSN